VTVNSDTELIRLAQRGDKSAFTQLVVLHQQLIRNYIAVRIRYPQDVDDLAQDTFILAFKKLSELEQPKAFRSWLCGIALNLVRNHSRKFNPTADGNESMLAHMITEQLEQDNEYMQAHFSIKYLQECLQSLPDNLQQMFTMHYQEHYSVKALTETYQAKHSTITMRLHRTRAALRKCIMDKLSRVEHE